jgi:hypothetical protein
MLEVSVAYNRYKFLGHEFLTWLWYIIEEEPERFSSLGGALTTIEVGNRIVLENHQEGVRESITIRGDEARLEEGRVALRKGALVTEFNLVLKAEDQQWQFSLKGESLSFGSLRTPRVGAVESEDDVDGAVLEKVYLYEQAVAAMDNLFASFIRLRVSDSWESQVLPAIKTWIAGRRAAGRE